MNEIILVLMVIIFAVGMGIVIRDVVFHGNERNLTK